MLWSNRSWLPESRLCDIKYEVQQQLSGKEALRGSAEAEAFPGPVVELVCDGASVGGFDGLRLELADDGEACLTVDEREQIVLVRYRARWRLIALDLSIDRATMPAQGPSDRRWPGSLPLQGRERMSLYRGELVVGPHE